MVEDARMKVRLVELGRRQQETAKLLGDQHLTVEQVAMQPPPIGPLRLGRAYNALERTTRFDLDWNGPSKCASAWLRAKISA